MLFTIGVFPIADHYYEPSFNPSNYRNRLRETRELPGLMIDLDSQLENLKAIVNRAELKSLEWDSQGSSQKFNIRNGSFEAGDAELYFTIIRNLKPSHILEIGSGQSTKVALAAIEMNSTATVLTCVEPYENEWLESLNINLIRERVENLDFSAFESLEPNDVLFIDSSHMFRPQGDVSFLIQQVLPRLKTGVYVHFHDIFTPHHYPEKAAIDEVRFWNEQYFLETFLANNSEWQVVFALNFMMRNGRDEVLKCFPYSSDATNPGSFWIRKMGSSDRA